MSEGYGRLWPVRQNHTVTVADLDPGGAVSDEALARWVGEACSAYLARCGALESQRSVSGHRLMRRPDRLPRGATLGRPELVVASAGGLQLHPNSFTIAVRLRPRGGDEAGWAVDVRCHVWLEDPASGRSVDLDGAVCGELRAIEGSARHHN